MFKSLQKRCWKHDWHITETSNIIQLDSMGYPLMLMIRKCKKCGIGEQVWRDVGAWVLDDKKFKILQWEKVGGKEDVD